MIFVVVKEIKRQSHTSRIFVTFGPSTSHLITVNPQLKPEALKSDVNCLIPCSLQMYGLSFRISVTSSQSKCDMMLHHIAISTDIAKSHLQVFDPICRAFRS